MKRLSSTMKRCFLPMLTACALIVSGALPADAAPRRAAKPKPDKVLEGQLLDQIRILSSEDFGGREPGTDGEAKTLRHIALQWFDIGLVSGTNEPGHDWFAPVTLVAREPAASVAQFTRKGRKLYVPQDAVLMLTSGRRSLVEGAPLLFVGKGKSVPQRAEVAGRVALLLDAGREDSERQDALLRAGAAAVLTVLDGDRDLESVSNRRQRSGYALASENLGGDLEGFITAEAMEQLLAVSGRHLATLEKNADDPGFAPRQLDISVTLEATTRETTIRTHNLIGKLPGRHPEAGAVLVLAHWDHFGTCAEPPAADVVCNGAIDNASGLAALTEIARRLAKGASMDRDVYFLATTAEEMGLLGAQAFAENPPLPLRQIVAAFNLDSVALAPFGAPLAIVGRGMTSLDPQIVEVARLQGRKVVENDDANAYVKRQDGWALLQHDVPAVMVTSAYSDIDRVERYMDTDYHRPSDEVKPGLELGGEAEDVPFQVALVRWFADPRKVPSRDN